MNTLVTICLVFMGAVAVASIIMIIPFRKIYRFLMVRFGEKDDVYITAFFHNKQPGNDLVTLLERGIINNVRTGNHGNDFPDHKNLKTFSRYATENINAAMDELEVGVL